jgi:hypothetical protein
MKTTTFTNREFLSKIIYYTRIAFLSGASTAFVCHSGTAQNSRPDNLQSEENNTSKNLVYTVKNDPHYLSTISTGPSYKYNITAFISNVLPANTVQYSDKSALQMNSDAKAIDNSAKALSAESKNLRTKASQAYTKEQAQQFAQQADALDAQSADKMYTAIVTYLNSDESQYESNNQVIINWQHNASYNTDVLTSAGLLTSDAQFYYTKSFNEIQKADNSALIYVKQGFMELAQSDMETALLKQQSAENMYISFKNSASVEVASRIDSILSAPDIQTRENAGKIIFCVQVGAYSNMVSVEKANKLLQIAGLGIMEHKENGVTKLTIGEYTSFTCADMLSEELVEDGYKESLIVTYNGTGKDAKAFEGIAVK